LLRLDHLAVLEFTGADATEFLNGQLSNDVLALAPGEQQLTSYNSPKGRVVAILTLAREDARALAALPAELAGIVLERLRKYVLRSKVSLRLATELAVFGALVDPARVAILPATGTAGRQRKRCERCVEARADRRRTGPGAHKYHRAVRRADAQPRPRRGHQFSQRLLHRPGDHRTHPESRPHQSAAC